MTLGTARPKAQGQEATNTPIPLSTIQQISHMGTSMSKKERSSDHVRIVNRLRIMTPFTK